MDKNILPDFQNDRNIDRLVIHYFDAFIFSTNSEVLIPFV